jgi:hypothetical protein
VEFVAGKPGTKVPEATHLWVEDYGPQHPTCLMASKSGLDYVVAQVTRRGELLLSSDLPPSLGFRMDEKNRVVVLP